MAQWAKRSKTIITMTIFNFDDYNFDKFDNPYQTGFVSSKSAIHGLADKLHWI